MTRTGHDRVHVRIRQQAPDNGVIQQRAVLQTHAQTNVVLVDADRSEFRDVQHIVVVQRPDGLLHGSLDVCRRVTDHRVHGFQLLVNGDIRIEDLSNRIKHYWGRRHNRAALRSDGLQRGTVLHRGAGYWQVGADRVSQLLRADIQLSSKGFVFARSSLEKTRCCAKCLKHSALRGAHKRTHSSSFWYTCKDVNGGISEDLRGAVRGERRATFLNRLL